MSTLYNNKYDILASTIQPNPASVKYWADLSSNPNGGDLKYFNGTKWILVNNKATEDISQIKQQIADLEQNKEDKVEVKDYLLKIILHKRKINLLVFRTIMIVK